ncbi:unnamed protein product [Ostreobium quekettii]|uniref:Uncharacterized protein n=1 Tax=Ostreobium quekettii TaxID=121088 RepID=A0A8S1JGT2_9CHLO|nr:unnamed protein product [Ostreobium quekettii]|eukprot:evm.model.scf_1691.2 EVM.evm.TU.scf_1691.2   scf_1691:6974-9417(-)
MAVLLAQGPRLAPWRAPGSEHRPRERSLAARATNRAETLRRLLAEPGLLVGPCCHDALSARLIERAAFPLAFLSGFTTSAARLAAPDAGMITLTEMLDAGLCVHEATRSLPVIGDGDDGHGNAVNVRRTVGSFARAGFAGVIIEDQVAPKSCGHVRRKQVLPRGEAVMKIRAAVDEREASGSGICIVARTDARRAESLEEALWRVAAFVDAGADVLFIDALDSVDEMRRFSLVNPGVPKMANMLEGGRTPLLTLDELADLDYKIVAYPLSLLGVSIRAMETALVGLKQGKIQPPAKLPSFEAIQEVVGFPEYFDMCDRYATDNAGSDTEADGGSAWSSKSSSVPGSRDPRNLQVEVSQDLDDIDTPQSRNGVSSPGVVEADAIISPDQVGPGGPQRQDAPAETTTSQQGAQGSELEVEVLQEADEMKLMKPKSIRVCIRKRETGEVEFETKIPPSLIAGVSSIVPTVADLEAMLTAALGRKWSPKEPVISIPSNGSQIEVWFE